MTGRCAGCGVVGSPRKVNQHLLTCEQFKELFRTDRARALDAASEYARFRTHDTPEARAEARDERLTALFADQETGLARQHARWATPPDLLEG
jgi:hypothetical protein